MSTLSASLIFFGVIVVVLLPMLAIYFVPRAAPPVAVLYLLSFLGLVAAKSDFSRLPPQVEAEARKSVAPAPGREVCAQALKVAEDGGIIVDRSSPSRVVVNGGVWRQLPQEAQDAISACLQGAGPDQGGAPLEIVER